ncbi:rhodanese-like domain-containing protein [Kiloniella laminariae]|uniref:rhodanese-like domain-containing protein n=1 Tax=Kiloniella laminariae TaxID=454162 RepID=UPI000367762E|nr:rhodanese-like domain-containing protein [Kiloniella laminariae]
MNNKSATAPVISLTRLLENARAEITEKTPQEVHQLMGQDDVLLIDIRDIRELTREGVIPGSYHCPRGMLEFWIAPDSPYHKPALSPDKHLILHCASGWRSALAAKSLQDMGCPRVSHLAGGFTAWKESGNKVEEKT